MISMFEDIKDITTNKITEIRIFRYLRNTFEDFIGKIKDKVLSERRIKDTIRKHIFFIDNSSRKSMSICIYVNLSRTLGKQIIVHIDIEIENSTTSSVYGDREGALK